MLGFVSIGSSPKWWSKFLTAGPTLEEEVRARGLPVIPLEKVERFQRQQVLNLRALSGELPVDGHWVRVRENRIIGLNPPDDVMLKVALAMTIPRATLYAQRLETDPFVFVTRRRWLKRETVCFAYWDAPGFQP
jgi:hypothetical protein